MADDNDIFNYEWMSRFLINELTVNLIRSTWDTNGLKRHKFTKCPFQLQILSTQDVIFLNSIFQSLRLIL